EKCWAKIKLVLRTLKARTAETLDPAIAEAIAAITAQDAMGWLHHCGYQHTKC
ncbi:MAG: IS630 family transposase, partial [Candidatus Angelobacter sp. Gp1-AA117]